MGQIELSERVIAVMRDAVRATDNGRTDLLELIDAFPACISYCDRFQRYRFVNRTYEEWFDLPREEVLGRTVNEVIGPSAYEVVAPWIRRALAGERVEFGTWLNYDPSRRRRVYVTLVPHRDRRSYGPPGYLALVQDVTRHRRLQAARRASLLTVD